MPTADTVVIILNWNGQKHLTTCLSSVQKQSYDRFRIMVVDNHSTDDSVAFVREHFPDVELLITRKNVGFSEGNNVGIRQAFRDPDIIYVAVLNNDTEVTADWLVQLVSTMKSDQKIGAVSSRMMHYDRRNIFDSAGDFLAPGAFKTVTRGSGEIDHGQYDVAQECFSARGGAALYRRTMLEDVRLGNDYYDSHYFAYIEDTDLSIRARLRGWRIMYCPTATVYHKVSATTNTLSQLFRRYHTGRNRVYTAVKNLPIRMWLVAMRGNTPTASEGQVSVPRKTWLYLRLCCAVVWALPRLLRQRRVITARRMISKRDILGWIDLFTL